MKDGQCFEAHRVVPVNSRLPFVLNIWKETDSHPIVKSQSKLADHIERISISA